MSSDTIPQASHAGSDARGGLFGNRAHPVDTSMHEGLGALVSLLGRHQDAAQRSVNLTPSENVLSPLARLPFVLDVYGRYFFDDLPSFGIHAFFGALESGEIELGLLVPLLKRMAGAEYVNVKPISGLNCMAIAIAALAGPGEVVLTLPTECGGHASTAALAERLGVVVRPLPMASAHCVDLSGLQARLRDDPPALIYLDQSTQLFPIDPGPLRELVDRCSPRTRIHFDSSHLNGLILGEAVSNPLARGAHSFGGSTHKTLPGPHKGFLATNDAVIAARIDEMSSIFVSHHQPAGIISLAATLLEMSECGGRVYARNVISNAQTLARLLHAEGVVVAGASEGFTACHQVWIDPQDEDGAVDLTGRLVESGLRVNRFGCLPGIPRPALRLSVAEVTRLGAGEEEMATLAAMLVDVIVKDVSAADLRGRVETLRARLDRPRFCFDLDDLAQAGAAPVFIEFVRNVLNPASCSVVAS